MTARSRPPPHHSRSQARRDKIQTAKGAAGWRQTCRREEARSGWTNGRLKTFMYFELKLATKRISKDVEPALDTNSSENYCLCAVHYKSRSWTSAPRRWCGEGKLLYRKQRSIFVLTSSPGGHQSPAPFAPSPVRKV